MHSNSPKPPNDSIPAQYDIQVNKENSLIPRLELEGDDSIKVALENEESLTKSLEDPLTQSRIQRLLELDNLADITLPGYAIKLIRLNGSTTFQEIAEEVAKCYHALRRSDGTKYHGDYIKALKGCLSSSGVFVEQRPNKWVINEAQAHVYESRTTEKIKSMLQKQVSKNLKDGIQTDFGQSTETAEKLEKYEKSEKLEKPEKHENNETGNKNGNSKGIVKSTNSKDTKNKRSSSDLDRMFALFSTTCKVYKKENKTENIFQDPFKNIKGGETLEQITNKIGKERLIGALQCFDYFSPIIEDYMRMKAASSDYKAVWKFLDEGNGKIGKLEKSPEKVPEKGNLGNDEA